MPLERYRSLIEEGEIRLDPLQEAAAARLDRLARDLEAAPALHANGGGLLARLGFGRDPEPVSAPRGVYLHGGVGRGKSMLMDLFADTLRGVPHRRVHFHEFMLEVQRRLHELRRAGPAEDPLNAVGQVGVAPVHDFAEQVGEQVDRLARHALLGGRSLVLLDRDRHVTDLATRRQ